MLACSELAGSRAECTAEKRIAPCSLLTTNAPGAAVLYSQYLSRWVAVEREMRGDPSEGWVHPPPAHSPPASGLSSDRSRELRRVHQRDVLKACVPRESRHVWRCRNERVKAEAGSQLVGVGGRQGEGCAAPRCIAREVWGVLRDPAPCSGAGCLHQEHHPRQQMELHWVYSEGHRQGRADTKVMCFFGE